MLDPAIFAFQACYVAPNRKLPPAVGTLHGDEIAHDEISLLLDIIMLIHFPVHLVDMPALFKN
jgi:hypothetical protein